MVVAAAPVVTELIDNVPIEALGLVLHGTK